MTEHCDCKVCNSETCNSSHRVKCFCHNISIKIQSSQRDPQETNSKDIKRHKHIYTICYKSIFISDFSAAMVKQSAASLFHITCLNCQNDFLVHSYGKTAIMKRLKNYSHKSSFDENQMNSPYSEKKTMKYIFPLELRKFCTFEYNDLEEYRDNDKKNKCFEYMKKFNQGIDINSTFEKETKKIENSFDDPLGAVFFQDVDPIVGPYTASPVLNWNATNLF